MLVTGIRSVPLQRRLLCMILQFGKINQVETIREKTTQPKNRVSWKPKPPKWSKNSYFKPAEGTEKWRDLILRYGQEKTREEPGSPVPVHMITRVKTLRHETKTSKEMCQHFGIHEKMHQPVVIANTEHNNNKLMIIKHLIRVKPVQAVDGLPQHPSDFIHTQLKTDGTFSVIKKLQESPGDSDEVKGRRLMTQYTIRKQLRKKVQRHEVLSEYFKTEPEWKYSEDGSQRLYKPKAGD